MDKTDMTDSIKLNQYKEMNEDAFTKDFEFGF